VTKSLDEFHRHRGRKDGHQPICKRCRAALDHERYLRTHESGSRHRNNAAFVRRRAEWMRSLKQGRPCSDCGGTFPPEAMQWDHLPGTPKRGDISALSGLSKEEILAEIAKCELVCTNCHILRTAARGGWKMRELAAPYERAS
jgi:hypothetical protein